MATEYWMIKKRHLDVEYYWAGWLGWSNERLRAMCYLTRENALSNLHNLRSLGNPRARIVHVRVRPRSERLWMAERIKAWEPAIRAALVWRDCALVDELAKINAFWRAVNEVPEKHQP